MFTLSNKRKNFNFIDILGCNNHLKIAKKIKKLGDGGFSNVNLYKCKKCTSFICNKIFVVKEIEINDKLIKNSKTSLEEKTKELVKMEYIMNKILNHDKIIRIMGVDINNMSLLYLNDNSNDLLYYLTLEEEFDSKRYFKYFIQIIEGVRYLHSLGIAHMDLKLENILLNNLENKIKIIDFGTSCFFKKGNETIYNKGLKGTECYMSPEIWKGAYMSDKVDIWCCGIILFNIIYNRPPWSVAKEYEDKTYRSFKKHRVENVLFSGIFEHPCQHGYNYDDSYIIYDLFFMMFTLEYYNRSNIENIYRKILKITLE